MRRETLAGELLGLPVLDAATGRRLGVVQDLVLSGTGERVRALVLAPPTWWQAPRLLPWERVQAAGSTAVLATPAPAPDLRPAPGTAGAAADAVAGAAADAAAGAAADATGGLRWRDLAGRPVLTDGGDELGLLSDIRVRPDGVVAGYQLSCGLLEDLLEGQPVLPGPLGLRPGPAAIVVPAAVISAGGERA